MDRDLLSILDAPLTLDEGDTSLIPVAKLGAYKDRRYGSFKITREDAASWQRNLSEAFGGEALIDFDHSPEKGKGTRAAGWITSLDVVGDKVMAAVRWSKAGAESIRNREYRYISPTFVSEWTDEHGAKRGRTLLGAGLTNRPFLRKGMPAISLSEDYAPIAAVASSDSRGRMSLSAIATKLGLSDDADEATILDAIDARPETPAGMVMLSADEHAALLADAEAGKQSSTDRFESAFTKALEAGRVAPASKEGFAKLAETDLDLAVKTLDELPAIVKTEPKGEPAGKTEAAASDRAELDARAKTLAAEKGISYIDAVYMLADEQEVQ